MAKARKKILHLLLLLAGICSLAKSQSFSSDTCPSSEPNLAQIESEADVVVGGVLQLHHPGQGIFGCGQPSTEGVQYFESLRWAISALNQKSGEFGGTPVTDSFIPGVKLGLQVYDSCGHKELAKRYMTELFPVMKSGSLMCDSLQDNSSTII
ncbi:uncharacterized protein LOC118198903, partial [Stegodyphus dumicola]|uniref:uncharacterized protein LOC118198903 n=1 Tax=Stegodyphus dumicola TaxID=202533 RepID=UPI0015AEF6A2